MASILSGQLGRMFSKLNMVLHLFIIGATLLTGTGAAGIFRKLCKQGEYLHTSPDGKEETCLSCTKGQTYMDSSSHRNHACFRCDLVRLGRGVQVKRQCDLTHNLELECKQGHFRNDYGGCTLCKKCDGDKVATQKCTQHTDTVCGDRSPNLSNNDTSASNGSLTNPVTVSPALPVNNDTGSVREANASFIIYNRKSENDNTALIVLASVGSICFTITLIIGVFLFVKVRNERRMRCGDGNDHIVLNQFTLVLSPGHADSPITVTENQTEPEFQDSIAVEYEQRPFLNGK